MEAIKTPYQIKKEKRDAAIVKEWEKLTSAPENSRTSVAELLAKKHNVHVTTIYEILRNAQ